MTAPAADRKLPDRPFGIPTVLALLVLGLLTTGTGVYFMALRPPLLPEDMRITGFVPGEASEALLRWLSIVFRTWGGFMVGFGLCLLGLAGSFWDGRDAWLRRGTALGVLFAFSSFLASNIQLHSDFFWFIVVLFVCACGSAGLLLLDGDWRLRRRIVPGRES